MHLIKISTAALAAFVTVALSAPAPVLTDGPDRNLTTSQGLATPGQEQAEPDLIDYHTDHNEKEAQELNKRGTAADCVRNKRLKRERTY